MIYNINDRNLIKSGFNNSKTRIFTSTKPEIFLDIKTCRQGEWISSIESAKKGPLSGVVTFSNHCSPYQALFANYFSNIPQALKSQPNWIWLTIDNEGNRTPYLCRGVSASNGLSRKNWIGFKTEPVNIDEDISGIAYVNVDNLLINNLKLVAIVINPEISGYSNMEVKNFWLSMGRPYIEFNLETHSWILLGLVSNKIHINKFDGILISTDIPYIELSGICAKGGLIDLSEKLPYLEISFNGSNKIITAKPETPKEIARLEVMLSYINPDCSYDLYMRVVWAILSLGWKSSEEIARNWSLKAPARFEEKTFINLVKSFNPSQHNSPTLGTIIHLARKEGWNG